MTIKEAIKIADKDKYAEKLDQVWEYPDRFVVSYCDKDGNAPAVSSLYVMKADGTTGVFFPPRYSKKFLDEGKRVY